MSAEYILPAPEMATVMVVELTLFPLGRREGQLPLPLCLPTPGSSRILKLRRSSHASRPQPTSEPFLPCCCSSEPSAMRDSSSDFSPVLGSGGRRWLVGSSLSAAVGLSASDIAGAVSTSRRALRGEKIPESDYTTLPNGLKYYDLKVGSGAEAVKGSRVAPYGFDVGQSEKGNVLKGLDLGVQGMRVGGQRLLIVPPQLAYGRRGVQEIPPNATIEGRHMVLNPFPMWCCSEVTSLVLPFDHLTSIWAYGQNKRDAGGPLHEGLVLYWLLG